VRASASARAIQGRRRDADLGCEDHEQENMGDIKGPGPPDDVGARIEPAFVAQGAAIGDAAGVASEQHEQLGGIAQREIAYGEIAEPVRGNVVGKDPPQSDAAEEVDPQIPVGLYQRQGHLCR
jgi:hypothetical protein